MHWLWVQLLWPLSATTLPLDYALQGARTSKALQERDLLLFVLTASPSTHTCAIAGQKRKRAEDQAAALVGIKKPNITPEPEVIRGPSASPRRAESMDHDGHSAAPSGMRAESELHVDTLGGAPQVSVGSLLPSVSTLCNLASCHEIANALSALHSNNS